MSLPTPQQARTVGEFIPTLADAYGERRAVVLGAEELTYAALGTRSAHLARGLLARGVGKGARVGLWMGNSPMWAVTWAAISRIGAVCVPISTFSAPGELARIVRHADLHALLVQHEFLDTSLPDRLELAFPALVGAPSPDLYLADAPFLRWVAVVGSECAPQWARDDGWLASGSELVPEELLAAAQREVHGDDEAITIYTSGQSADPKGVVHTHDSVMTKTHYLREMMGFNAATVEHATMPFFWVGGLVMHLLSALETGAVVVCADRSSFGPQRVIGNAAHADEPDDLVVHMVASPSLGMTETFGMYAWGNEPTAARSPIAAPLDFFQPGFEVRVVDANGHDVDDGERGEIIVRGPCVARRIHKVARTDGFDEAGFYRTHDEGEVEGDRIHFVGRLGDMIKTAGANVAPAEVERALSELDDVLFAAVVGLDDDERGQIVAAAVVPVDGAVLEPSELRVRLRAQLSGYKIPRRFLILEAFAEVPVTPSLKVSKRELAELIERDGVDAGSLPPAG